MGWVLAAMLLLGMLLPERFQMPVRNAGKASFHPQSFWYYPWGKSGTHKGVDIFAPKGEAVMAASDGLVLYTGNWKMGGKVVCILSAQWRIHYYAHLNAIQTHTGQWRSAGALIGSVGTSGNAEGKAPHLHYSILSLIPLPYRIDTSPQGWKKMFYLDPVEKLQKLYE
ncbi:MAG: M23 family metallopeptidase [Cytophagaceae bacterium]|nr:M23 family metallopeptidase [Cytophagaceae bacterium]